MGMWSAAMVRRQMDLLDGMSPVLHQVQSRRLRQPSKRLLCWLAAAGMLVAQVCGFPAIAAPASLEDALTQQLQVNRQRYGIVGQAVSVVHNGKPLFGGVDGLAGMDTKQPVTPEQIFPAFSLSKLFVSTLIMQLIEAGQIDPGQPARHYLPGLPQRWEHISVAQLLNHTSGLPEYFEPSQMSGTDKASTSFPATAQALFEVLAARPLLCVHGSETRYVNTNDVVLAQLLQAHDRKPCAQVASERIITRLHLSHTFLGRSTLPAHGVATAYLGKDGKLQQELQRALPDYALGHGDLYTRIDDLRTFLEAMRTGKLVGKATLQRLWQPQVLANGQQGWFASVREIGQDDAYPSVGHGGGARVRVRIVFDKTLDGDGDSIVYLTNGSARNVWSRVLVDRILASVSPRRFRSKSLCETLIAFALRASDEKDASGLAEALGTDVGFSGDALERAIKTTGYTILSNLGADAATRVFTLNAQMFAASRNALDSLAEAYDAAGDAARATQIRQTLKLRGCLHN
ncbi:serine hydrolase domain-containing protein [Xanthomonas oryzae pv. oryzicola]|uniref:serine hydrolase domain-containing protein n=1 Tax=Xanthomonas oryzae TaxID=347 RepID=UPI003D17E077